VRAIWGGVIKPIELSRSTYSFNELRDEVRVKHEVKEFQLRYSSPSAGEIFIQDDASFRKVVKDAEVRGSVYVEVKLISQERAPGNKTSTPSPASYNQPSRSAPTNYSAPQSNYGAPVTSPKSYAAPPPTSGGNVQLATSGNTIASFTVPGDRNSPNDKLTVKANQEDDHFAFVPQPAKFPSEVAATLDGTKLTFESVTNTPDGRSFKFTQAFNLPFTPNNSKTHVAGYTLKLYFA